MHYVQRGLWNLLYSERWQKVWPLLYTVLGTWWLNRLLFRKWGGSSPSTAKVPLLGNSICTRGMGIIADPALWPQLPNKQMRRGKREEKKKVSSRKPKQITNHLMNRVKWLEAQGRKLDRAAASSHLSHQMIRIFSSLIHDSFGVYHRVTAWTFIKQLSQITCQHLMQM